MTSRYRVTVTGPLARSAANLIHTRFDGVTIRAGTVHRGGRTVMELDLVDQAALRALLTLLWDVGHDVLSVDSRPTPSPKEITP